MTLTWYLGNPNVASCIGQFNYVYSEVSPTLLEQVCCPQTVLYHFL